MLINLSIEKKECVVNESDLNTGNCFKWLYKKNNSIDENKGQSDLTLYWDGEHVNEVKKSLNV